MFKYIANIIIDSNRPFRLVFIDRNNLCSIEDIYLLLDRWESPSQFCFQSPHRNPLSTKYEIFQNIYLRLRSKEFLYIHTPADN